MNKTHILTGEELTAEQISNLLNQALILKKERNDTPTRTDLAGKHLALLFEKSSLRTRLSFTVAMRELGGEVMESIESTRKKETPEDQARVLNGYCHAIMLRTHQDSNLQNMSQASNVPIINGLSDLHHPCQILADLMTLLEIFGTLKNLTLCYIGDGNNILHSLLLLAPQMGVNIHYCCPASRGPNIDILKRSLAALGSHTGHIKSFDNPESAVINVQAIYTDVWNSMGFEDQQADHLFKGFQVTEALMQCALPNAVFMHCLPMERGKEVSETLPDQPCSVIFQQSENRLHIQKALLLYLLAEKLS
jgi:ornithine carbamoyltransferase